MEQRIRSTETLRTNESSVVPQWWVQFDGHVISGALVERDKISVEAQILLDGAFIYGSRHSSRVVAEQELATLRHRYEGWTEPS